MILYDDSDGWYDHQMGPIVTQSQTPLDALTGHGLVRHEHGQGAERAAGPLRRRPAAAAAGGLAIQQAQLRRRHVHGAVVGRPLHRGQLARRPADRRRLGRRLDRTLANMFDFSRPKIRRCSSIRPPASRCSRGTEHRLGTGIGGHGAEPAHRARDAGPGRLSAEDRLAGPRLDRVAGLLGCQSVIATWPGWAATRSSQARIAG